MGDGECSKSAISLSSSDDEEANKDLSLAIVEKARKLESSRKRPGAGDLIVIPSDSSDGVDLVMNGMEEMKEEKKRKKRKLRDKKKKKKDGENEKEKEGSGEPFGTTDPVVAKVDGESDNVILRKLLRGPRYFDPGERNLDACFDCGEEGHVAVDCTEEKRKKPCFVCGMFGHYAKHCTQGQDCYICRRRDHIAKNCPDKHNHTSSGSIICLKCGDLGHDMLSCNNDYSHEDLEGIQCYICKDYGYLCCMDIIVISAREVSCYNCAQSGHNGLGCAKQHGQTNELCYKCGEEGHFARGCTKYAMFDRCEDGSTPRRFTNENYKGSRSAPIGFCRAHKNENMHFGDRWNMSTGKSFSNSEMASIAAQFQYTLILKFSTGCPMLVRVKDYISRWGLKKAYSVVPMDSRHVVLHLTDPEDHVAAWTSSARRIDSSLFRLLKWTADFNPREESAIAAVWVRFPNPHLLCFVPAALRRMANSFGKFLKMAEETRAFSNANYARVCVELDLAKPLPSRLKIIMGDKGEFFQPIIYESNVRYCHHCLLQGHDSDGCFRAHPELKKQPTSSTPSPIDNPTDHSARKPNTHLRFGSSDTRVSNKLQALEADSDAEIHSTPLVSAPPLPARQDAEPTHTTPPIFVNRTGEAPTPACIATHHSPPPIHPLEEANSALLVVSAHSSLAHPSAVQTSPLLPAPEQRGVVLSDDDCSSNISVYSEDSEADLDSFLDQLAPAPPLVSACLSRDSKSSSAKLIQRLVEDSIVGILKEWTPADLGVAPPPGPLSSSSTDLSSGTHAAAGTNKKPHDQVLGDSSLHTAYTSYSSSKDTPGRHPTPKGSSPLNPEAIPYIPLIPEVSEALVDQHGEMDDFLQAIDPSFTSDSDSNGDDFLKVYETFPAFTPKRFPRKGRRRTLLQHNPPSHVVSTTHVLKRNQSRRLGTTHPSRGECNRGIDFL